MDKIREIIREEINSYFKTNPYSLKDEIIIESEVILGELLNPDNALSYKGDKGWFYYTDPNGVEFFVRAFYNPVREYFELKTGWINDLGKPQYEPSIPYGNEKTSAKDIHSRSDTVAKIYRDEILPFFDNQNISDILVIDPISSSRGKFAERMVKKFTPINKYDIEYDRMIIIRKNNGK